MHWPRLIGSCWSECIQASALYMLGGRLRAILSQNPRVDSNVLTRKLQRKLYHNMASVTTTVICILFFLSFAEHDLNIPQVAITYYNTCFSQYGQVVCWGLNAYGQLGRGGTDSIGYRASDIGLILTPIDLGMTSPSNRWPGAAMGTYVPCRLMEGSNAGVITGTVSTLHSTTAWRLIIHIYANICFSKI